MDKKTRAATASKVSADTLKVLTELQKIKQDPKAFHGACNLDCAAVRIPGVRRDDIQAMQEAFAQGGLGAYYRDTGMWAGYFLIYPPTGHQGSFRTRQAEVIADEFQKLGYETTVYYAID